MSSTVWNMHNNIISDVWMYLQDNINILLNHVMTDFNIGLQYDSAEWKPAFLRQAREFLFFPLLPREASKSVSIFDRETGSEPERLRSDFLQADLSLIV